MWRSKILLAEDSEVLAETIQDYLVREGYQVSLAKNGLDVLQYPSLDSVDLIIMDIEMPFMDGLKATRELRNRGYTMPIVAYTGSQDPFIKNRVLDAGCSTYIEKSADHKSLGALISTLEVSAHV